MTSQPFRTYWRRCLKLAFWFLVDSLALLGPTRPQPQRILLVRVDRIGDFLLWLHSAQTISRHLRAQGKTLILVAEASWAAWATELGLADHVIPFHPGRFDTDMPYRLHLLRQIRALKCGTAINPIYSRSWGAGDVLIRASGATHRIAPTANPETVNPIELAIANRWYTQLLPARSGPLMELDRNAEFTAALLQQPCQPAIGDLRSALPALDLSTLIPGLTPGQPFYVLFPGASAPGRCWPAENFREIAMRIHQQTGWLGVVCGGPADREIAHKLTENSPVPLADTTGKTSLAQLAALIAAARLVVSNDTSAVHIAAAVSVPSVCVLGGGHIARFLPYSVPAANPLATPLIASHPMPCFGCNWNCIYPTLPQNPWPCITNVTVQSVWQQVQTLLPA